MEPVQIHDDVLVDPKAFRAWALQQPFGDVPIGEDVFKGIAACPVALLPARLTARLLGPVTLSFFRQSPAGQREPTYLHSDAAMGDWTGILYLTPTPPIGDGTSFWERLSTGHIAGPWDAETERAATDLTLWTPWRQVPAQFNRLLLFQAALFHSRTLVDNYGDGDDARLTLVLFGQDAQDEGRW